MRIKLVWVLAAVSCIAACAARLSTETRFLRHQNAGDKAYVEKNYAEAEKQYKAALAIAEEKGPENYLTVQGLYYLAQVYSAQERDGEAEELLRRRVAIADKVHLDDPEYLAMTYGDLAIFYLLGKRYEEAKPFFRRALLIRENAFGPNDPRLKDSLEYYVMLLRYKNRYDDATELQRWAGLFKSNSQDSPQS